MQNNLLQEALNENTTAERLRELIKSSDESVCVAIAKDEDDSVRIMLAGNSNTPRHVLEMLATDKHYEVRARVFKNTNFTI
jgi:3'-phosphoadenosine 5'-phosphosulfate sulfotransferase (PAPS reductase)/FAD synthetase